MKGRPFILQSIAFFMLLVFSQKAGVGFHLHNLFHSTAATDKNSSQEHDESKDPSYSCTCVDDLSMPFTDAEVQAYSLPKANYTTTLTFFKEDILFYRLVRSLLRGPPDAV